MYCQGQRETSSQHKNEFINSTESALKAQGAEQQVFSSFPILKAFGSSLLSPMYIHVQKRTKATHGSGQSGVCAGNAGHPLAKDSLSWINWKRRRKSHCLSVGRSGGGVPKWVHMQTTSCCHLLATQVKGTTPVTTGQAWLFNHAGSERRTTELISACLTFAKMISTYLDDTLVGNE